MQSRIVDIVNRLLLALVAFFVLLTLSQAFLAQDIDPEDAEAVRRIIARANMLEAKAAEEKAQKEAWQESAANWKKLYEAEKDRADRVQGGRVDDLNDALAAEREAHSLTKRQVVVYEEQRKADKDYITRLERDNRSLKKQRWWFGVGGFVAGTLVGGRVNF